MHELPLFFRDGSHRDHTLSQLKLAACPHCGRANELIRNGKLRGNDPASNRDARVVRGQRIRCSNRNQRRGCGRSLSIFEARVLPGFSVDARLLWAFLAALLENASVHAAAQTILRYFSLSSAYRWRRRLANIQSALRHRLCSLRPAPASSSSDPLRQLIDHFREASLGKANPVEAYQAHFHRPFFEA